MATVASGQPRTMDPATFSASRFRDRMLGDLAPTQRRVTAAGVDTAYYEIGEGPPLVLLHGGIECGGVMWSPVVGALARQYRVIVPDVPGMGESAPLERLDPESFSRWLTSLSAAIDVQRPIVLAHSLVGALTQRHAIDHGGNLDRLIIYASPGPGKYRMPLRLMYVAVRLQLRPTPKNDERFGRFALLDYDATRARDIDWFEAFIDYSLSCAARPAVKRTMKTLIRSCTKRIPDEELRRITIPVDLLWGEGDRMMPLAFAKEANRRLGWPLHVIPGTAHAPHIEHPDTFVDTLLSIIASPTAAQATAAASPSGNPDGFAFAAMEKRST
jgi:pimeloyl-ACP methyl ester carboxylesterase